VNILSSHFNWKVMVMRILLNGLTLAITVLIVPGVYAVDPSILGFLTLGVIFGVINAVIKPFVQILTLRFLFVSYGLVVIIINSVVLIVLALLAQNLIVMERLISVIIAAAIVGLVGGFLESIFGVTPPIIDMQSASVSE
jgi:putative membrane protein